MLQCSSDAAIASVYFPALPSVCFFSVSMGSFKAFKEDVHGFGNIQPKELKSQTTCQTTLIETRQGRTKILKYSFDKLVKSSAVWTMLAKGTVFRLHKTIYTSMSGYYILFFASFIALRYFSDLERFERVALPPILEASKTLQRFCPLLFGLFTSIVLSRWWSIRTAAVGKITNQVINLSGLLVSLGARKWQRPEDWDSFRIHHASFVRYGLACVSCVTFESRGANETDLDRLVSDGYLTIEEKQILANSVETSLRHHSITLACWMSALSTELFEMMKIPAPHHNMVVQELLVGASGIHTLGQFLRTQLPFPYIHLITLLVNVNNSVMSVVAGSKFAVALHSGNVSASFAAFLQVAMVPLLYQCLLTVCVFLTDPVGQDLIDFPIRFYQLEIINACTSQLSTRKFFEKHTPLPNAQRLALTPQKVAGTVSTVESPDPPPVIQQKRVASSIPSAIPEVVEKLNHRFELLSTCICTLTDIVKALQVQLELVAPPRNLSSVAMKSLNDASICKDDGTGCNLADVRVGSADRAR